MSQNQSGDTHKNEQSASEKHQDTKQQKTNRGTFRKRWKQETAGNQAMVVLTAIIAIFSLAVASVTAMQIWLYWKAVKLENRAYTHVKEVLPLPIVVGFDPHVVVRIENVGKTPGYNLAHLIDMKRGGTGVWQVEWEKLSQLVPSATNVIGAGQTADIVFPSLDSPASSARIKNSADSAATVNG